MMIAPPTTAAELASASLAWPRSGWTQCGNGSVTFECDSGQYGLWSALYVATRSDPTPRSQSWAGWLMKCWVKLAAGSVNPSQVMLQSELIRVTAERSASTITALPSSAKSWPPAPAWPNTSR